MVVMNCHQNLEGCGARLNPSPRWQTEGWRRGKIGGVAVKLVAPRAIRTTAETRTLAFSREISAEHAMQGGRAL